METEKLTAAERRYQAALRGIDPDIIKSVEGLTDAGLIQEAVARSGLGRRTFAEDVLMVGFSTLWKYATGQRLMAPFRRRFLRREVIRSRQMSREGTLPKASYCGACGRGGRGPILITAHPYPAGKE